VKVTEVSDGGGPEVSSTTAVASGTMRTADGSTLDLGPARPPHPAARLVATAAARQRRLARLQRLRDIPVINPLPA
jgi:hypothetical protein